MLNNVQVLRALAAYLVVIAHMAGLGIPGAGQGIFGVDLFFVISGFVMVYTTAGRPVTPGAFMINRVIRIVPLYWALTLAVFCVALVLPRLLNNTDPSPVALAKSLFFIAYEKHDGVVQPLLFPGWSLNYEMLFYLLFASTLLLRRTAARFGLTFALLGALVLAGLILQPADPVARFYTSTIQLEFGFGCVLGLLHAGIARTAPPPILLYGLGVACFVLMLAPGLPTEGGLRFLLPGLPATAIVYAALALEARGHRYTGRSLLMMGAASYSLYLSHVYVVLPITMLAARLGMNAGWGALPFILLGLALVSLVAIACHLLLERPLSALLKGVVDPRHRSESSYAEALWPWRWPRSRLSRGRVKPAG